MTTFSLENPDMMEKQDSIENPDAIIGNYKLYSNCNNENAIYKYNEMPDCVKKHCQAIKCKPLKDLSIDVNQISDSSLKKVIGEGGFNVVYDITYNKTKPIVLRILKNGIANYKTITNEQNGLIFQTRISKSIEEGGYGCPHIAKVYDFGIYNNKSVYAILEKCKMDLFDKMVSLSEKKAIFSEDQLKNVTKQCLEALHCLHKHEIYHLDLKPENIMMNDEEKVSDIKLIDFGASVQKNEKINLYAHTYGTPGYYSPNYVKRRIYKNLKIDSVSSVRETCVLFSPQPIDDLWSLGITIMKMIFESFQLIKINGEFQGLFDKVFLGEGKENIQFGNFKKTSFRSYMNTVGDPSKEGLVLIPRDITYEAIVQDKFDTGYKEDTESLYRKTGFSQECAEFLKRIFANVIINEKGELDLLYEFNNLTSKDLLQDPWLNVQTTNGGKKNQTKKKRTKSKNKKM